MHSYRNCGGSPVTGVPTAILSFLYIKSGIDELQILPEERATKTPTWEQIQRLFAYQFKNELTDSGALIKTFWDDLTCHQKRVIELMEIPISTYGGCPNTDEQGV